MEAATINLLWTLVLYGIPALAMLVGLGALLSIAKSLRTLVHAHKLGPVPLGSQRDDIFEHDD